MPADHKTPRPPRSLVQRVIYPFLRGKQPQQTEPTGLFTDTSLCIGCKACQVACKQWNMLPGEPPQLSGRSYDNTLQLSARTWRHVKFAELADARTPSNNTHGLRWLLASDSCKHCGDAPCLRACPTGALLRTETGGVYAQADICNGCASCVAACPFGVIARDEASGHSRKCTLCLDRVRDGMEPACAKTCPTASLRFGPLDSLRQEARQRLEHLHSAGVAGARLYGVDALDGYAPLHNMFLLLDDPARYGLPERPVHPARLLRGDYLRAGLGLLVGLCAVSLAFVLGGAV